MHVQEKGAGSYRLPLKILAIIWSLLFMSLVVVADLGTPENKVESDYHTSFYIAGAMLAEGKSAELYPPKSVNTFAGQPFDKLAHEKFSAASKEYVFMFMYSPLVALFFAPLSMVPPHLGLLIFQSLSVTALAVGCLLFAKSEGYGKESFFTAFAFLPVITTVWIGQLGLLFGLLPFCAGYYFLRKQKDFLAGLLWSAALLKPQLFPAACICAFLLLFQKRAGAVLGLICGSLVFLLANLCFGVDLLLNWFSSLGISESILSGTQFQSRNYLIASLPGAILSQLPSALRLDWKWLVYGGCLAVEAAYCFLLHRLVLRQENRTLAEQCIVMLALLSLPIFSPRLLLYDLCIFMLPALIAVRWRDGIMSRPLLFFLFGINCYIIAALFIDHALSPLTLAAWLLLAPVAGLLYLLRERKAQILDH
jgi:hypothetical protein